MKKIIEKAREAWMASSGLRASRRRLKAFAFGRQWNDPVRTPDGRVVTELTRCMEEGRVPVTNNIIRRMVKTIIGHYRHLSAADSGSEVTLTSFPETDARALEELLISGCAVQRVDPESKEIVNVSPERLIFRRFLLPDASDCTLIGMLHDLPLWEVLDRFAGGDLIKARGIRELYRHTGAGPQFAIGSAAEEVSFATATLPDTVRVIEVWEHTVDELVEVTEGETRRTVTGSEWDALVRNSSRRRGKGRRPEPQGRRVSRHRWQGHWLTPEGIEIGSREAARHPFAVRFYPMIDGELHSAVEDVIDQQKMVNRLVSTLDHTIACAAKGVLLYPADQLPDGISWQELRRIWSNPQGILPFRRSSKSVMPYQVHSGNVGAGATDLLKMQLDLFDRLSGATGALSGRSSAAKGEGMLRAEMEYSAISILDLLNSFHTFIRERDRLAGDKKSETAKEEKI